MKKGSAKLRDSVLTMLAERDAKFSAQVFTHSAARRAIAKGVYRADVQALFDLSDTAYEQLAGQALAGAA